MKCLLDRWNGKVKDVRESRKWTKNKIRSMTFPIQSMFNHSQPTRKISHAKYIHVFLDSFYIFQKLECISNPIYMQ